MKRIEFQRGANLSVTIYNPAPLPSNEAARNQAVYASGLLENSDDTALNRLSVLAKDLFRADWAGITLIYDDVQCVIASSGGRLGHHHRARSMSAYAILKPAEVFCLLDAKQDDRFGANPFVRVGLIRFFVAAPVIDAQGYALGTLCVSSSLPRHTIDPEALAKLQNLAARVVHTPTA